jgi:hypothetical protein
LAVRIGGIKARAGKAESREDIRPGRHKAGKHRVTESTEPGMHKAGKT